MNVFPRPVYAHRTARTRPASDAMSHARTKSGATRLNARPAVTGRYEGGHYVARSLAAESVRWPKARRNPALPAIAERRFHPARVTPNQRPSPRQRASQIRYEKQHDRPGATRDRKSVV